MHYNVNVTVRHTSVLFGKGDGISKEFFGDGRVEVFDVEYTAKVCWCLSCMDENQLITDVEFFHWLRPLFRLIVVLMFSRSCLLIRPISLLAGLISRQLGLF